MQEVLPRLRAIFYAGDEADGRVHRNDRRAAIAEKRKRDADDGGYADAHADVYKRLERKRRGNAEADEHSEAAARACADDAAADDDHSKQHDDDNARYHAQLLADGGEDAVGVARVIARLREASLTKAHARPAAGGKRILTQICLPGYALTRGVDNVGDIRREDAVFLILLQNEVPHERDHRRRARRRDSQPIPRNARAHEHDDEYGKENKRTAEVVRDDKQQTEIQRPVQHELDEAGEAV